MHNSRVSESYTVDLTLYSIRGLHISIENTEREPISGRIQFGRKTKEKEDEIKVTGPLV